MALAQSCNQIVLHDIATIGALEALVGTSNQVAYLGSYLSDMGAAWAIEESHYIDRDYLDDFAAFYGKSARGFPNHCRRLHFFRGPRIDRKGLEALLGGDADVADAVTVDYLGFCVVRPIPRAPLGRTVLGWYGHADPPRVVAPTKRPYVTHLAGFKFTVHGLAWQQQDASVARCATVAVWTMLQALSLDARYAAPTTAEVTRLAHAAGGPRLGRIFPSAGLDATQVVAAIEACQLAPLVIGGDLTDDIEGHSFSSEAFAQQICVLLRSGFPVLVVGRYPGGQNHAVCAVGFRDVPVLAAVVDGVRIHESNVSCYYLHDDNIGPAARFRLGERRARLMAEAPQRAGQPRGRPAQTPDFVPKLLIAAVPKGLCISPRAMLDEVERLAAAWLAATHQTGITLSVRYALASELLGRHLPTTLQGRDAVLGRVRLEVAENVEGLSLYVGVATLSQGQANLAEIWFDTTDADVHLRVLANIGYVSAFIRQFRTVARRLRVDLGRDFDAW